MRFVYLDNFRGFTQTSIPLRDVNFLVGENSTGKTSLLKMIRMFSGPQLIMGPDFPGEGIPLGHFGEWVSVHSDNQDYFRLGMIESSANQKSPRGHGIMLTYIQDSGQPKISHLTCSIGDREITLKIDGDKYYFKIEACPPFKTERDLSDRLAVWAAEHAGPGQNLRELRLPKGIGLPELKEVPLGLVLSLAARFGDKGRKTAESFSFFVPTFGPPLVWIAPIRTPPRRTYDEPHIGFSPEGQHTPYVIRKMLSSERDARRFKSFIERIGHESGLFEKIELKYFGNKNDSSSPFEIDAYLHKSPLHLGWVGYGVSQALPVLVEILHRPSGSWFAIQQPEVHLHPRAQASLGDAFFEMAASDKKGFVIETHSDFTIDRFRMNYRKRRPKTAARLPSGQVLFFERTGGNNKVTAIPIDKHGNMSQDQPDAYREFFIREQINLLT